MSSVRRGIALPAPMISHWKASMQVAHAAANRWQVATRSGSRCDVGCLVHEPMRGARTGSLTADQGIMSYVYDDASRLD